MRVMVKPLILALCALFLVAPARGEDETEDRLVRRTDVAIEKGTRYLLAEQKRGGSWSGETGHTGLALLALHRSGVREGTPAFDRGLKWLVARRKGMKTYDTSLAIMVLVEVSPTKHREIIRRLALMGVHDVSVTKFVPYPGSALFDEMLAAGRIELNDDFFLSPFSFYDDKSAAALL